MAVCRETLQWEADHRLPEQGETLGRVPLGLELLLDGGGSRGPIWALHGGVGLYSVRRGIRMPAFSTICGDPIPRKTRDPSRDHTLNRVEWLSRLLFNTQRNNNKSN